MCHHGHGFLEICTIGGFSRALLHVPSSTALAHQHIGVWGEGVDHGFKHLRSSDHGHQLVALADHHFLSQKHLLDRNLHAVASRHHDTICGIHDVIEVLRPS